MSLAGAVTSIIFVATKVCRDKHVFVPTKHVFCRKKSTSFVATKVCLSRQNYVCHDKAFVVTNICRDKHEFDKSFVSTRTRLSRQNFCHDKHTFVVTKDVFCRDKHMFVATKTILVEAPANDSPVPATDHGEGCWQAYVTDCSSEVTAKQHQTGAVPTGNNRQCSLLDPSVHRPQMV